MKERDYSFTYTFVNKISREQIYGRAELSSLVSCVQYVGYLPSETNKNNWKSISINKIVYSLEFYRLPFQLQDLKDYLKL